MWQQIKSGGWLTRERLHSYARILLTVSPAAGTIWIALADGLIDRNDKPIGIDFSNVWGPAKMGSRQRSTSRRASTQWKQKPSAAVRCRSSAGTTRRSFSSWLPGSRSCPMARPWRCGCCSRCPPTFGQNSFLTAALLGGSLLLLDKRPIVAGVLIGLLSYKPQFGLLIPLVLVATGRWTEMVEQQHRGLRLRCDSSPVRLGV